VSVHTRNLALVWESHFQAKARLCVAQTKDSFNKMVAPLNPSPLASIQKVINIAPKLFLEVHDEACSLVLETNSRLFNLLKQLIFIIFPMLETLDSLVSSYIILPCSVDAHVSKQPTLVMFVLILGRNTLPVGHVLRYILWLN
jgi:hypothetical protein